MGKVWYNGEWWDENVLDEYMCDHEDGHDAHRGPEPELPKIPSATPLSDTLYLLVCLLFFIGLPVFIFFALVIKTPEF